MHISIPNYRFGYTQFKRYFYGYRDIFVQLAPRNKFVIRLTNVEEDENVQNLHVMLVLRLLEYVVLDEQLGCSHH